MVMVMVLPVTSVAFKRFLEKRVCGVGRKCYEEVVYVKRKKFVNGAWRCFAVRGGSNMPRKDEGVLYILWEFV